MIGEVREEHPEMPIERLCELMGVNRSWYYERPSATEKANKEVELRDAIERIVLEFPGNVPATRTPTDYYGSTSPKAQI